MLNKSQPRTMLLNEQDYQEFRNTITTLWQANAIAEIIASTDVEHIDQAVLQTAVRGIEKFTAQAVMTLEELGVENE